MARQDGAVARRLNQAVGEAARRIGERPGIGHVRLELAPARYRFWRLTGFPYVLVYEVEAKPPRVARMLHLARDFAPLLTELAPDLDPPPG